MLASVMPGHEKAMIPRITPTRPRNTSDHQFLASASSIELLLLSGYAACSKVRQPACARSRRASETQARSQGGAGIQLAELLPHAATPPCSKIPQAAWSAVPLAGS